MNDDIFSRGNFKNINSLIKNYGWNKEIYINDECSIWFIKSEIDHKISDLGELIIYPKDEGFLRIYHCRKDSIYKDQKGIFQLTINNRLIKSEYELIDDISSKSFSTVLYIESLIKNNKDNENE